MHKDAIKNKVMYFISLGIMIFILLMIAYFFFLRNIEVDIMSNAKFTYTGENGTATVEVTPEEGDLNQRIQDFLDSVEYTVTPNTNLSNGDIIHVTATYDEQLAREYHYQPATTEMDVEVSGLNNRYEKLADIPKSYLKEARQNAKDYIKERSKDIYMLDGQQDEDIPISKYSIVYQAYLKSDQSKNSDRFLYVFKLEYEEEALYYVVNIPNVNDSNEVVFANVYGEKAYLTQSELENQNYANYIDRLYSSQYSIESIE